jgi:signal transduction histidine kinase
MRWILLLMSLFFVSFTAKSQLKDSLVRVLKSTNLPDTTRVLTLVRVSFQIADAKPDSAYKLSLQADSIAAKLGYTKGKGRAKRGIARYFFVRGLFKESIAALQEAIEFCRIANDKRGEANAQVDLGSTYKNLGNYAESSNCNFRAIKLFKELGPGPGNEQALSAAYVNIAILFKDLRIDEKFLSYTDSARIIKEKVKDKIGLGRIYSNLGNFYLESGDLKKSQEYLEKALAISNELNAKELKIFVLSDLGRNVISSGDFTLAQTYLNEARELAININSEVRRADVAAAQAFLYLKRGMGSKALDEAINSEILARRVGEPIAVLKALQLKHSAFEMLGLSNEALKYYKQSVALSDSLKNDESWKQALMREYTLKEEKIVLEQEKKDLEHIAAKAKQQIVINTIAGLSFSLLVISIIMFINNRQVKKQRNEILKSKEELERARKLIETQNQQISFRNEILEVEVQKRTRDLVEYNHQLEQFAFATAHNLRAPVARILGLGNVLHSANHPVNQLREISGKMVETSRELDKVVSEINTIVRSNRDVISHTDKLVLKEEFRIIKELLSNQIAESGAVINEDFSLVCSIQSVKTYCHSIFFNLVNNAIKFRKPGTPLMIQIRSEQVGHFTVVTVADNGLGFDLGLFGEKIFNIYSRFHTHMEGRGLGLYQVKTQLSHMGGHIEVDSEVGKGTVFKVYLKN